MQCHEIESQKSWNILDLTLDQLDLFEQGQTKFAISEIWNRFIDNCVTRYKPRPKSVGRQLFPCKWRCPFTQCITSKPDKFCVKFWQAVDTQSKYLLKAQPYFGKDDTWWSNQPVTSRKDYPLSLVAEMQQIFMNAGATSRLKELMMIWSFKRYRH